MSKEERISVKIGFDERVDVLPDLQQIYLYDENGDEHSVLYFTHVSQVITLINALQEMKESFINELK